MFERYTEKARRAVFFARYEASVHGRPQIDTCCLLMGILREDRDLMARLVPDRADKLCQLWMDVEALFPKTNRKIPTNIDLPLSDAAKRALAYAAGEAERRCHECIEPRHVLWGLFTAGGPETACMKSSGLAVETVNADLEKIGAETDLLERHAIRRIVDSLPKERLSAAALLLGGLAAKQFEVSGTGPGGPFHFSFGDETE
jgi:ATP-dependent Clp protease ATP-binding subunit ClpC